MHGKRDVLAKISKGDEKALDKKMGLGLKWRRQACEAWTSMINQSPPKLNPKHSAQEEMRLCTSPEVKKTKYGRMAQDLQTESKELAVD